MVLPKSVLTDPRYENRLVAMNSLDEIPEPWRDTPIEGLIRAENMGQRLEEKVGEPQLLIATCIEFRYALPIPRMYAYVIRRASGRLNGSEFSMAYVLAQGVRHLALIGHNDCGMTKVAEKRQSLIDALIDQGWNPDRAEDYINANAARHMIPDELEGLKREYIRLRRIFKKLVVAPMFVDLSDTHLFVPKWYFELDEKRILEEPTTDHVCDVDLITHVGI